MRVLALDTTTRGGSAALVEDQQVIAEGVGDAARSQAEQLPALLQQLLDKTAIPLSGVDRFAVASGPGSFTGLRIGIATIQGLALVCGRRVIPVSALEALGQMGGRGLSSGSLVAAWMDAYRREVFTALYRVTDAPEFSRERLVEVDAASVGDPVTTLQRWESFHVPSSSVFIGDGAVAYAEAIGPRGVVRPPDALAASVGLTAVWYARAGAEVEPGSVQPLYVRRPDVELARDRQTSVR